MSVAVLGPADSVAGFDLDNVARIAKKMSETPYQEPKAEVPEALRKISYDRWRDIRFRPEGALWRTRGLPFAVGKDQVFGLSARGLAIDVGPPKGEEFPFFREIWLVRPAREARDIQPGISHFPRPAVIPGAELGAGRHFFSIR